MGKDALEMIFGSLIYCTLFFSKPAGDRRILGLTVDIANTNPGSMDSVLSSISTLSMSPPVALEQKSVLLEPYMYMASSLEKEAPSQLIRAFSHWLQVSPAQLDAIVRVVEFLRTAGSLVDDIEDGSELRGGKPVAHKIFGAPQTINSANYVYTIAYQEVLEIASTMKGEDTSKHALSFSRILNDEMLALHREQGNELLWREHLQCPTEEEYIQMVKGKIGALFRIAVRLMAECAKSDLKTDTNYIPLANLLAVWLQIRVDYMNLQHPESMESKGFAESLSEGKFSFPIIHGIRAKPDSKYILSVLHRKPKDPVLKDNTISFLKEVTHSFEYTRSALKSLESQVRAEVTRLGGNPALKAILDELAF